MKLILNIFLRSKLEFFFINYFFNLIIFLFSFLVLRIFSSSVFGFKIYSLPEKIQIIISGLFSDFFVASILSVFLSGLIFLCLFFIVKTNLFQYFGRAFFVLYLSVLYLLFILIFCQIEYINFFGTNVTIAHLSYLFDIDFLTATVKSMISYKLIFILFFLTALFFTVFFITTIFLTSRKKLLLCGIIFLAFSPLAQVIKHQVNIRNNRSIPENLLHNFLEDITIKAYAISKESADNNLIIGIDELIFLNDWKQKNGADNGILQDNLLKILLNIREKDQNIKTIDPYLMKQVIEFGSKNADSILGLNLKQIVKNYSHEKQPLFIWVVLLESFRPIDGRFFYPDNPHSFEPFYDELAKNGLSFLNAWSVGMTTHSAQEGALCGFWSGSLNKILQHNSAPFPCLFDNVKNKFGDLAFTAFWHGGDLSFDKQGDFWRRHHVEKIVGRADFPKEAPSTGWGVSDLSLINFIHKFLHAREKPKSIELHALLTVTNHHDWTLPDDSPFKADSLQGARAPLLKTILYTDYAIRKFVDNLKSTPIQQGNDSESYWDHSLIFFMNDHGANEPTYKNPKYGAFDISKKLDLETADRKTRLGLVLQGGIIEKLFKTSYPAKTDKSGTVLKNIVNQADVPTTIADLLELGEERHTLSDSLFAKERRWPVFIDLGSHIFVPPPFKLGQGFVFRREDIIKNKFPEALKNDSLNEYYRAAFHLFRVNQKLLQLKMSNL